MTRLVLGVPGLVWLLIPLALTAGSIWLLVASRNGTLKVVVPLCAYVVELAMVGIVVLAVIYPILLLQSAVRGS